MKKYPFSYYVKNVIENMIINSNTHLLKYSFVLKYCPVSGLLFFINYFLPFYI